MLTHDDPIGAFLAWMKDQRHAQSSTLTKYRLVLHAYEDWLLTTEWRLPSATTEAVEAFTRRPRTTDEAAANATVTVEVAIVAAFYRWAVRRLRWKDNPAELAGRPKVHNRQPRPIDDADWLATWEQPLDDVARVMLGLGFFCGLRREELTTLAGSQIWNGRISSFIRKGGGEDHFDWSDVLDHFAYALPHLQGERLPDPLLRLARERNLQRLVPWSSRRPEALNKRMAGWLPEGVFFTPHQLRHSFATNLLRSGVPLDVACDLCNHSSPTITMRYVKTSGGRLAALRTTHVKENQG